MEQGTKFEVASMTVLEGAGATKALATVAINGEFVVNGVKVLESEKGLFVAMPSSRDNYGEYRDVVFPVTKAAREAFNNAVLGTYGDMAAQGLDKIKNEIDIPEKSVSKVYAQMHEVNSDRTNTKAAGQITIDDCFVVTNVKINDAVNKEGQKFSSVTMPAKPNEVGGYDDIAHAITSDFHKTIEKAVLASVNNIGRYEYKGVKFDELGDNPAKSVPLNPKFADKLMAQLDKAGISYQAKCAETVTISVKASDKQSFENVKKELVAKLNGKDKQQNTQTQTETKGTQSKARK